MKPPGRANALMVSSRTKKNWKRCAESPVACATIREPSACRYSVDSGSSMTWPSSRSWRTICRPMRYSSSSDNTDEAGLPMSGKSLPTSCASDCGGRASIVTRTPTSRCFRPILRADWGMWAWTIALAPEFGLGPSEGVRGEIRQAGALAAHQRDVTGMRPAAEPVDDVSQARRGLGEVRGVDLRNIAQADDLGSRARARDQRLHLLGREVLRLVEDHEAIEEGAAAHEVKRADLDAIAQQVVGRGASPVAAFAAAGQHLEVVHECAHPRLHLLFLGARQEADVLSEGNGHTRHDDFDEAVRFQRLHETGGEREQGLARAGGSQDGHEI